MLGIVALVEKTLDKNSLPYVIINVLKNDLKLHMIVHIEEQISYTLLIKQHESFIHFSLSHTHIAVYVARVDW